MVRNEREKQNRKKKSKENICDSYFWKREEGDKNAREIKTKKMVKRDEAKVNAGNVGYRKTLRGFCMLLRGLFSSSGSFSSFSLLIFSSQL